MICVPEVIGKVARFVVNLEREDRGEGAALHKVGGSLRFWLNLIYAQQTYTMTSVHWDVEEHDCLPMMRVPYSCDLGTPNCRFCVRLQSKAEARATTRFS
jgi:hypothetical protein